MRIQYSAQTPATAAESAFVFYDVESLHNIFTVVCFDLRGRGSVEVFCQIDDPELIRDFSAEVWSGRARTAVLDANPALKQLRPDAELTFYNLANDDGARALARSLGGLSLDKRPHCPATAETKSQRAQQYPLTTDTDPGYDPAEHPFIAGYNSLNYDTTVLSVYFAERLCAGEDEDSCAPVSAAAMRGHNDQLFTPAYISYMPRYLNDSDHPRSQVWLRLWRAMHNSGRHLDIARLNELQQKVALKRLLGQMGYQILESDRLSGANARVSNVQDILDLLAYNTSDVVGTHLLFTDPTYSSAFDLRAGLLRTYPETVFEHTGDNATPDQDTTKVRFDRLTTDTSSAKFAGRILAPYRPLYRIPEHVGDLPVVSYRYPHPSVAGERPVTNVLTELRNFFFDHVEDPAARAAFGEVYSYYRSIEGLNFNSNFADEDDTVHQVVQELVRVLGRRPASQRATDAVTQLTELLLESDEHGTDVLYGQVRAALRLARMELADKASLRHVEYLEVFFAAKHDSLIPLDPAQDVDPEAVVIHYDGLEANTSVDNDFHVLQSVARPPANVPYVTEEGRATGCFATFSTGGIHGAEYNTALYEHDNAEDAARWRFFRRVIETAVAQAKEAQLRPPENEKEAKRIADALAWADGVRDDDPVLLQEDGTPYDRRDLALGAWWMRSKIRLQVLHPDSGDMVEVHQQDVIAAGTKAKAPRWRTEPKHSRSSQLFIAKGSSEKPLLPAGVPAEELVHRDTKINPSYVFTSVGEVIHEDFTSYYPLMLTNMAAFANPDLAVEGEVARDKYREIFDLKQEYGVRMKDRSLPSAERARLKTLREGTKLILTAASGAADARHATPIRMNNRIIAMRIIGQMFSWRIGQAQTFAGGRIVSTNTDGLYSTLDFETNQEVLDQHTDAIGVEIEPESLLLVSKDSNNRVELSVGEQENPLHREVHSASGGTLACWEGPTPRKALNHPAVVDRLLLDYFRLVAGGYVPPQGFAAAPQYEGLPLSMDQPMNTLAVQGLLERLHRVLSVEDLLGLYQNLVAASPGKNAYLYSVPWQAPDEDTCSAETEQEPESGTEEADGLETDESGEEVFASVLSDRSANDPAIIAHPRAATPLEGAPPRVTATLMQHYSRIFVVRPDLLHPDLGEPVAIASAKTKVVSSTLLAARAKKGGRLTNRASEASLPAEYLLTQAGVDLSRFPKHDVILARHSGVDPRAPMVVFNDTIKHSDRPERLQALLRAVDQRAYVAMAVSSYEKNWRNIMPTK